MDHSWKSRDRERTAAERREANKLMMMRRSKTNSSTIYGMGGMLKGNGHRPKPVSLAPVNLPELE